MSGRRGRHVNGVSEVSGTTSHRYSGRALLADHIRAGAGAALTLGPLVFLDVAPAAVYIMLLLGALFVVFGARTALRQLTRATLSDSEVRIDGPRRVTLRWSDLDGMKLSYFSTRRDRREGWMQLTLKGAGRTLRFDSSIEDFIVLVRRAHAVATARHIALAPATLTNLASLGITVDETGVAA